MHTTEIYNMALGIIQRVSQQSLGQRRGIAAQDSYTDDSEVILCPWSFLI
jgi:hypothetical protein